MAANPTSSFTITADATTAAVGLTVDASTNFTATSTANSSRTTLQGNYNSLLTQIDQLAGDSSYNGVNLLNGNNLKVVFNETNTSSLTIAGVTFNSAGLGLSQLNGNGQYRVPVGHRRSRAPSTRSARRCRPFALRP